MKVGDLIRCSSEMYDELGLLGMVVELEVYDGTLGFWVSYFQSDWRWHSVGDVEVISD